MSHYYDTYTILSSEFLLLYAHQDLLRLSESFINYS